MCVHTRPTASWDCVRNGGEGGACREGEEAAAAEQDLEQFVSHSRRREGKGVVVALGPGLLTITVVQRPAEKVGQTGKKKKKRRGRHERRRKE